MLTITISKTKKSTFINSKDINKAIKPMPKAKIHFI
jgi:hypothetical protein